jgi:hypothetical protein
MVFSAMDGKNCISLEYITARNPSYTNHEDYQYKQFFWHVGYRDLVFDEGQKLDIDQTVLSAYDLIGIHFESGFKTENIDELYDVFVEKNEIPCIGVAAYCYDKSGVDIRTIMRNYVMSECYPQLDTGWKDWLRLARWGAADPMLTLRACNWERYFYFCRFNVQKYMDQGSRGVFKIDALDYRSFDAQVGDVILVYHKGPGNPADHAALVTEVENGEIIQVVGTSETYGDVVVDYGVITSGQYAGFNDFFVLEKDSKIAIVGYPAGCTE